ncbi:MAG: Cof-type HAD-IIB family hydrolase [Clostridium sp.]|jgi:Cof subfamily protein (haloacid dehalogenase superfamily)|uniref:Cof-type HAD-IIB family hydrolase n=1 Tax=Clostridium sp. TaxID=1506 RepID=UPI0025C19432|nr:Cof-type HAD-IIB family hydrolase [Clostridium sp.]MCH3964902.1 Cof-type HAD-IIB family hydrolase [Clostridium sp.]MCI1716604.1 Cof-type HAD-IIB family hydrolase [Clostridium sp.]MCI1800914.1 Cof-type HAD-IIB family hydrolase [Clostridium sp.]MCI1814781.1 Cof-type HAD-IIB family hydrolase [Clostridium sp.]MCI1871661.1 Cof-type HAD-IIB family hydrolase [Clostridium sp.]
MYKLIAIDMDGTLLRNDKTISSENIAAIKEAVEHNVKIIPATGRPSKGIKKYLEQLNLISDSNYVVSLNGALVESAKSHRSIYEKLLSLDDIKYIYELGTKISTNIQVSLKESIITPVPNKYSTGDAILNGIELKIEDFCKLSPDDHIFKVMFMGDEPVLSKGIDMLPENIYHKYTVLRSEPYFLEFMNKATNKWNGVETAAKNLGIKKSEIICIGDSGNDIHMIKSAGLGVAMGNASNEIKKLSSYVTKTNEENGVAHVIYKFILK